MDIIESVQAEISPSRGWQTVEGSIYEDPLRSLGCILQQGKMVDMVASFGRNIDLSVIEPCGNLFTIVYQ